MTDNMTITFACPTCQSAVNLPFSEGTTGIECRTCGASVKVTQDAVRGQELKKCLVCPSMELFVRKDFPQRVGVAIVGLGLAASCVAWYYHMILTTFGILLASALLDVGLYVLTGDLLECYRCHAQYRGVANLTSGDPFDLEIHEKHRQQQAPVGASSTNG